MSSVPAPDVPQIERALDALLERTSDARLLGMRAPARRAWPPEIVRRGRAFSLAWCASELEIRERLNAAEQTGEGLVVLTPVDASSLSADILARFPRARLEQADRWAALRAAFRAHDVDPRLRGHGWLADLLLASVPTSGYPPVAGGLLDLETVWLAFLEHILGLPDGRVDAASLLAWSLDPACTQRLVSLAEPARFAAVERLTGQGGPGAGHILAAVISGRGEGALPAALTCGVVFGTDALQSGLRDAAVRLEPFFGGVSIDRRAGSVLADAARIVTKRLAVSRPVVARAVQARASSLLVEIRAEKWAANSPALEIGLDARISEAAKAIDHAVESGRSDKLRSAWTLVSRAREHDCAEDAKQRLARLLMAVRLAGWLLSPATLPPTFAAAASAYATNESFADLARETLRAGDPLLEVANTYERLREAARRRREDWSRAFASLLVTWNESGGRGHDPLPVEKILDRVVAPLGREAPLLLLVLDGLSFAVWHRLLEDIERLGWKPLAPENARRLPAGVAALPTITQVSRTSLLCGTLELGQQTRERTGFSGNGNLISVSRPRKPPLLFHKADLGRGAELEEPVRSALADPSQRIVGIVHNAVDAQLSGSDQLDLSWSADQMRQLAALLRLSRDAGRVVVVASDHGHVVDDETTASAGDGASRWRVPGAPETGEMLVTGGRVLSPAGTHCIVAAWSESVRYSARHAGYHGGISPQEVLVPIAVLGAAEPPRGWVDTPAERPGWWLGADIFVTPHELSVAAQAERVVRSEPGDLFAGGLDPVPARSIRPVPASAPWIVDLLRNDSFVAQKRIAGRAAPRDEQIEALLAMVSARGGRASAANLAQALGMPAFRIGGLVTAAGRVLNLDQARIIFIDGADVVVDERLLRKQFGLAEET